jgi:urease accessory protein
MHLVTRMLEPASSLPPEGQVVLAAERRQFLKRRWRGVAEDGTEFGFDLESRLTDGGVIFREGGKDYIVRQLHETVYEVAFESRAHAALAAWKTGNLHLPAQIFDGFIRVLHDDAMRQLLEREGWNFTEPVVLFQPLKAMAHAV